MKKRNVAAIIGATAAAIGAMIGIGALVKKGKNDDSEECAACEDVAYEESDSEEESEE